MRCRFYDFGRLTLWSTRRWNPNNQGAAGADGSALNRPETLVEADFDGGEIVVATTYGEALTGNLWVVHHEEVHDLVGGH